MEKIYIKETQSFGWTFFVILLFVAVLFGILCFFQLILNKPMGNHPAPSWLLMVICLLTMAFAVIFKLQHLKTTITEKAVYISFGILSGKQVIPLTSIKSITIRKYDGMNEFSGWGVKSNDQEKCYSVSGNEAIEIAMKNSDKKILIGTQRPEAMQAVIDQYLINR